MPEINLEAIVQHLDGRNVPYRVVDPEQALLAFLPGPKGFYPVLFRLDREREVLKLRTSRLLVVEGERRAAVAQVVAHLNGCLLLGSFSLDLSDGEVSFDLPLLFVGVGLAEEQLERAIMAVMWTLDQLLPTVQRVAVSEDSPELALGLPQRSPLQAFLEAAGREDDAPEQRSA